MSEILSINCNKEFYDEFYNKNKNHSTDCGFDLFCPNDLVIPAKSLSNKVNLEVKCKLDRISNCMITSVGYKLYPRSSMGSKTPLRLSNSTGVVDPSYRGNLMAIVDNNSDKDYLIKRGDRLVQVVSFTGNPITCIFVDYLDKTIRGDGGLGSTGK
jgi:dUTP pyrophosphatase